MLDGHDAGAQYLGHRALVSRGRRPDTSPQTCCKAVERERLPLGPTFGWLPTRALGCGLNGGDSRAASIAPSNETRSSSFEPRLRTRRRNVSSECFWLDLSSQSDPELLAFDPGNLALHPA